MISFVYHNPSFGNFNAKAVTIEYSTALKKYEKKIAIVGFEPGTFS